MNHRNGPPQLENYQLAKLIELGEIQVFQNHRIIHLLRVIAKEVEPPYLAAIQIQFSKGTPPMPTPGPITLTAVGQTATATVVGFNQFGNPFSGTMPPATLTSDDASGAIVTFDPTTGLTTAVADGVANITGSLTTAEGLALTDTETVTVAITPPPAEVLTSIKVAF